jgi:hypothetical protein
MFMNRLVIVILFALLCGAFATEFWNPCTRCLDDNCSPALKKSCESYKQMIKKNPNIRFDNEEESDFSLTCTKQCAEYWACLGKGAWGGNTAQCSKPAGCECNKFFWQKDETEADAEFFKKLGGLVKKVAPIAKKGFDMYKKAKGLGILADAEAEKLNLKELIQKVKAKIQERKQKRAEKKQKKEKPAETESDAEFFKKLGGLVKKVAPIAKKGFDMYKKAKGLGILADAEAEKAAFLKKLIEKVKAKIQERKQKKAEKKAEVESDFLFRKKKVGSESDAEFFGKLLKKLKEKKQKKQQEQPESDKINLACTAECAMYWTCRAKGDDHSKCISPSGCQCNKFWFQKDAAEETESEKINWKKIFSPENIKKAVEIYKIIRSDAVETA